MTIIAGLAFLLFSCTKTTENQATVAPPDSPSTSLSQSPSTTPASSTPPSQPLPPSTANLPLWTPDLVPEMVVMDFRQEDLAEGPVTEWKSRGVKPRAAAGTATKLANKAGVQFAKGTTQQLLWQTDNQAPWLHRWWVVIARADAGSTDKDVPVLTIHGSGGGTIHRQPYVKFVAGKGKLQSSLSNGSGPVVQEGDCLKSTTDWNIAVGFRRGNQYHAWINGVKQVPVAFTGMEACRDSSNSYLGANDAEKTMSADMAIDCVIVGQSELNDAQVDKLVGWAHWRAGRQDLLPKDHPYKNVPPRGLDANDNPSRFIFDQAAWDKWTETCLATKKATLGMTPPNLDDGKGNDYAVVFFDDFKTDTVVDDLTGDPSAIWYCPSHMGNIIDADATAQKKSSKPSTYIHDPSGTGTLALRMLDVNGRWRSGAFTSVNHEGQGRSWDKGRFRIRCKFPKMQSPRPGFFPAFWSYGTQHLFWRTRNRVELDYFEYDGRNGAWINTTQHVHAKAIIPFDSPEIRKSPDVSYKIAGRELNAKNNFTPTIDIYDGEFHVWEFRIENDFSYMIIDDKEVVRVPTESWILVKKYILVDWALRAKERAPVIGKTYDMTIDWIEVQQRERDLAVVPAGFNSRPVLSGERGAGKTITCTPNVKASQIEYRWYKNGEPVVGATGATFTEDGDSAGKSLRCNVRAVSLLNQPEAWTAELNGKK